MNDCRKFWDECLVIFKDNLTDAVYNTWFAPIQPSGLEENRLVLCVPSMFFYEYLEEKYSSIIHSTLKRVAGREIELCYRVLVASNTTTDYPTSQEAKSAHVIRETSNVTRTAEKPEFEHNLNTFYNFNSFIEGTSNKLPRTAGIAISNDPGKSIFNPLFIYGASGVGKTHLANAIGVKTKQLHPEKRVLYVSAKLFEMQYVESVKNNNTNNFLQFYQSIDVLILDDIQEFMNKVGTQNTFFHIFNHLHQSGKQLIFTSDRSPGMLQGMEDRLLTRFKWGLSAEIVKPDFELRKSIIKNKIYKDGLEIPEDVIDFIAEYVEDNVRNIEGVLASLLAHSTLTDAEINMELVTKVVGNVVSFTPKILTVEKIRDIVCEYFQISEEAILSSTRKREIAQARQIAMYLSKNHTKSSLSMIGRTIGNRDHSTVLHACSVVSDLIETDKTIKKSLQDLEALLKNK